MRIKWFLRAAGVFLVALMGNGQGFALPPLRPGLGDHAVRQVADPEKLPWSAVGRVQTEVGGRCTGFLIAPAVVETAAHCLWISATRHYVQPEHIHFLRAYQKGQFSAHSRVARFLISPSFDPEKEGQTAGEDRATLFLATPVSRADQVLPVMETVPQPGTSVVLGGYEQDFREIIVADMSCHITAVVHDGAGHPLLAHDCSATRGSSGGPLLVFQNDKWMAAGVQDLANYGRGGSASVLTHAGDL